MASRMNKTKAQLMLDNEELELKVLRLTRSNISLRNHIKENVICSYSCAACRRVDEQLAGMKR